MYTKATNTGKNAIFRKYSSLGDTVLTLFPDEGQIWHKNVYHAKFHSYLYIWLKNHQKIAIMTKLSNIGRSSLGMLIPKKSHSRVLIGQSRDLRSRLLFGLGGAAILVS